MPDTRVVIVDYDGADVLPRCLTSLVETVSPDTIITVIDNASPVDSKLLVPDVLKNRIEVIRLESNKGYAGAIAYAWYLCFEDFLAICNNDIEFTPGWLDQLVSTAESTRAHAVSAVIEHENESDLERTTNASLNPLLYLIPGVFRDRTKAVYPSGACFLLRRDRSMSLPVDPDYFLYYEDVYIGFLLRAMGKTVVQCNDAKVQHVGSHSVGRMRSSEITKIQERNRLVTQILFFDTPTLIAFSPMIFLDSLFKIPQCWILGKDPLAAISAHWDVLRDRKAILRKKAELRKIPDFNAARILPYLTGKVLPPHVIGAGLINAISSGWCRLMGIPVDREAGK
jgi:GT2 family glycosyltransferase